MLIIRTKIIKDKSILRNGPTDELDGNVITVEPEYPINTT